MNKNSYLAIFIILAVLVVFFALWFYGPEEHSSGIVNRTWTETSTSCSSEGSCTTTTIYYVQLDDERIYTFIWDNADYDHVQDGDKINFYARGRRLFFFRWRVAVPAIFTIESINGESYEW